jgi:transcriptional regulator with XRE-family HTH domain
MAHTSSEPTGGPLSERERIARERYLLGFVIKLARRAKRPSAPYGWRLTDFAALLGTTASTVCQWENGRRGVTEERVAAIAELLGETPLAMYARLVDFSRGADVLAPPFPRTPGSAAKPVAPKRPRGRPRKNPLPGA